MFNKLKNINFIRLFKLNRLEKPVIFALAIGVFFLLNIITSPLSFRLDLSKGQAYTLSPSTKKILNQLDDLVTINFYVSSDLPTRLLPLKTEVIDLIKEYKKAQNGKIIVKILDPKTNQNALNDAREAGLPELQFSQLEQDKYAVTTAYFGVVINFSNKKELLPQVTETGNLEYNLTSAIYRLTKKEIAKIGIIGEESDTTNQTPSQISVLEQVARQQFDITPIDNITNDSNNLNTYNTIIILDNNKKKFEDNEIKTIKNYVSSGGRVIVFIDGVWITDSLSTASAEHNLFQLTQDFGIKINRDLVLSTSAELVNFGNQTMQFMTPYPFWLKTNNFTPNSPYLSNINQITYPWASSLTLENKNGIVVKEIVKSTKNSWALSNPTTDGFSLNPQEIANPQVSDLKEFILAAQAQKGKGVLIVISSSRFINDRYLNQRSNNLEFVLNILDNLASAGALTGIRSRATSFYPLPEIPQTQKEIFRYANIILLPILFAFYGGFRLLKRK